MATLSMPQLGESVTEGTILQWLVALGAVVALDDPLVEVETEKVTVEIPSPFAGTLEAVLVAEGETVPVGAPLAEIATADEPAPAPAPTPVALPALDPPHDGPPAGLAEAPAPATGEPKRRYSPAVTRLAREHGLNPDVLSGTGAGGRVTRKDVLAAVEAGAAHPPAHAAPAAPAQVTGPTLAKGALTAGDRVIEQTPTRRRIAQHLLESKRNAPHAWLLVECEATALVARRAADRAAFRDRQGTDLTYLPYVARAVCRALREFPEINATWADDQLIQRAGINLGVAVDAPQGLIVPVVRDADRLTVGGLARAMADLAERARSRTLRLDEVTGGSFTLDNTGVFGTTATAPIINAPQVAILTTEAIIKRPIVTADSAIAVRPMMNLCLSFDHRAMDGSTAARFTTRVRDLVQSLDEDSAAE